MQMRGGNYTRTVQFCTVLSSTSHPPIRVESVDPVTEACAQSAIRSQLSLGKAPKPARKDDGPSYDDISPPPRPMRAVHGKLLFRNSLPALGYTTGTAVAGEDVAWNSPPQGTVRYWNCSRGVQYSSSSPSGAFGLHRDVMRCETSHGLGP